MHLNLSRALRYCAVSATSVGISQAVLILAFGLWHLPARTANLLACAMATGPSYVLNRNWAWGRNGRSSLWREVVPFWLVAFAGLAFSTWATDLASSLAHQRQLSHTTATAVVALASLAAFGTLWVAKFVLFETVLFRDRRARPARPIRDGAAVASLRMLPVVAALGALLAAGLVAARPADAAGPPAALQSEPTQPSTSQPPTTGAPTTAPPATEPPTTAPPTTEAPTSTEPPTTATPTTEAPTTLTPTTAGPPTTLAPPTTVSPTTGPMVSPADRTTDPARTPVPTALERGMVALRLNTSLQGPSAGPGAPAPVAVLASGGGKRASEKPAVNGRTIGRVLGAHAQLPRQALNEVTQTFRRMSTGEALLLAMLSLLAVTLTTIAGSTLWWMLHSWRTPQAPAEAGFSGAAAEPRLSFSLIVPARHEQAVLGETLARLAATDHPDFEILAVVGDDDPETAAVARAAARRHRGRIRVLVDTNRSKNKPKALNTALPSCRGEVVGVFDAEDEVHPELLRHVDARFTETGADVIQSGVQLMNFQSSWFAVHNVLEYYFWFRSRLHFQARQRFIPLGGNTVFIRTSLLRRAAGWDPTCLAEDCELGVRLSSMGARVSVAYDPALATREETPGTVGEFLKQRTRWNQGFIQVLAKGEWRRLPTLRQRLFARYTLATPFLQAFIGLLIPASLAMVLLVRVPVLATLISFLPLLPMLAVLVVEAVGLAEFCRDYGLRPRWRDYARLIAGMLPYHLLLAVAATRAVVREVRGDRGWEKTAHVGAHRSEPAPAGSAG
jgi:cellulose synthase/poly-beta-1,6-N-acetylglucosamine synthase-like glycosyltransferase/putative flippase GtrA